MMPEPRWQDPAPLEIAFVHLMQEIAQRFTPKKQTPDWVREVLIYFTWRLGSVWSISEMQKASSEASEWAIEIEGLADQLGKALERGLNPSNTGTNSMSNPSTGGTTGMSQNGMKKDGMSNNMNKGAESKDGDGMPKGGMKK